MSTSGFRPIGEPRHHSNVSLLPLSLKQSVNCQRQNASLTAAAGGLDGP